MQSDHVCNANDCPEAGGYYVSCTDAGQVWLMAGPFQSHSEALSIQDKALHIANDIDGRAWFMAWGTCRVKEGELKPGVLNKHSLL